jgi:hypothetical protein
MRSPSFQSRSASHWSRARRRASCLVTAKPPAKPAAPAVTPEAPVAAGEAGEPAQSATPDPHDDDALWRAFLAQGDRAIAMASYSEGPLDEEIVEKVRAMIGAWQRLLVLLTAELSKDSESWE